MPKGGRRVGAGRPRKAEQAERQRVTLRAAARARAMEYLDQGADPLKVLLQVAFDRTESSSLRVQAAAAAAAFMHPKLTAQAVATATVSAPVDGRKALDKLMARLQSLPAPTEPGAREITQEPEPAGAGGQAEPGAKP
jgi:hypothetical protein